MWHNFRLKIKEMDKLVPIKMIDYKIGIDIALQINDFSTYANFAIFLECRLL